jgi:hypothetical protein
MRTQLKPLLLRFLLLPQCPRRLVAAETVYAVFVAIVVAVVVEHGGCCGSMHVTIWFQKKNLSSTLAGEKMLCHVPFSHKQTIVCHISLLFLHPTTHQNDDNNRGS